MVSDYSHDYEQISSQSFEDLNNDDKATQHESKTRERKFNALCFKRLCRIFKYCLGQFLTKNYFFLAILCVFNGLEIFVGYFVGTLPSRILIPLGHRDRIGFLKVTVSGLGLVITAALCKAFKQYSSSKFSIESRKNLTTKIHHVCFKGNNHYDLSVNEKHGFDNVDQRITQDTKLLCDSLAEVLMNLLILPFTITFYSYKTFIVCGWLGIGSIYFYFIVSCLINKVFMSKLVLKVYDVEKNEGDFRHVHSKLRINAEGRAFYNSSKPDKKVLKRILDNLINSQNFVVRRQLLLNCAVYIFDYVGGIMSYFVVAIPILTGKYNDLDATETMSLVSKFCFLTIYLIMCFSQVMDQMSKVSLLASYTHRVGEIFELADEMRNQEKDKIKEEMTSSFDNDVTFHDNCQLNNRKDKNMNINNNYTNNNNEDNIVEGTILSKSNSSRSNDIDSNNNDGNRKNDKTSASDNLESMSKRISYGSFASTEMDDHCRLLSNCEKDDNDNSDERKSDCKNNAFNTKDRRCSNSSNNSSISNSSSISMGWGDRGSYKTIDGDIVSLHEVFIKHRSLSGYLVEDLTLTINRNDRLLIQGPSGCGKTSLARVLRGLWRPSSGKIRMNRSAVFLPQIPYMCESCLADNVTYPAKPKYSDGTVILELLKFIGLSSLTKQLGLFEIPAVGWYEKLTNGEQQRLSLLRVLYHNPKFAVLDEATNAVDSATEQKFYNRLQELNITPISIGHLSSLKKYHTQLLTLGLNGTWNLCELE